VTGDGTDVTATVYTSAAKTTESGFDRRSRTSATARSNSFSDLDALAQLEVTTAP
jgi:hypothetical protein